MNREAGKRGCISCGRKMKQEQGRDMVIYGSATLVTTLMKAELIDEFQLLLYPIVLGSGRPEFKDLSKRYLMEPVDVNGFKSGVVKLVYQPLRGAKQSVPREESLGDAANESWVGRASLKLITEPTQI